MKPFPGSLHKLPKVGVNYGIWNLVTQVRQPLILSTHVSAHCGWALTGIVM